MGSATERVLEAVGKAQEALDSTASAMDAAGVALSDAPGAEESLSSMVGCIATAQRLAGAGYFDEHPSVAGTYVDSLEWMVSTVRLLSHMLDGDLPGKSLEA